MAERFAIHDEFFFAALADKERHLRRSLDMFWGGGEAVIEVEFDSYQALYARAEAEGHDARAIAKNTEAL